MGVSCWKQMVMALWGRMGKMEGRDGAATYGVTWASRLMVVGWRAMLLVRGRHMGRGLLPALEELLVQGAMDGGGARRLDRAARGRMATEMGHDLTIFGVVTLLPTFWTVPIS
ncbi:hypothetical protein ACLOJK_019982 [Asimina triloba]